MNYKNYRIEPLGTFPMYKIMGPGSGPVPTSLIGTFTSTMNAQVAVDMYLDSLKKGKSNVKKKGPGRD